MKITHVVFAAVLSLSAVATTHAADGDWPRWRGVDGSGITKEAVPTEWSGKSVVWKAELKGTGQSSPTVLGDKIFLTSATDGGQKRLTFCLDRTSGKLVWEASVPSSNPEGIHKMNSWASPTVATDGERVYVFFGRAGAHCYTIDGKHVWSQQLGDFQSGTKRGIAASPVVAGDLVIINGDSESDPFLFGLDKLTGKIFWKTDRPAKEGYSTPILITVDGHDELVLNGDPFVGGYDPKTGKLLWSCKSFNGRGEPSVVAADGLIYAVCGLPADVYCVKPGGKGDVTATNLVWRGARKAGRDGPSPIVESGVMVVANMAGIATGYDAKTGKQVWQQRLGTGQITASPIAAGGKVYFLFEDGKTTVIDAKDGKLGATSSVDAPAGEVFRASITPSHGQLLIRSDKTLYCVGK